MLSREEEMHELGDQLFRPVEPSQKGYSLSLGILSAEHIKMMIPNETPTSTLGS
jgi:hypothetical protein